MATLIPTTETTSFDSTGKRRPPERLRQMLSGYSLWHTVRVNPKQPVNCGREGQAPTIIELFTLRDKTFALDDSQASTHKVRFSWGDMAVLCADWTTMDLCASALVQRKPNASSRTAFANAPATTTPAQTPFR